MTTQKRTFSDTNAARPTLAVERKKNSIKRHKGPVPPLKKYDISTDGDSGSASDDVEEHSDTESEVEEREQKASAGPQNKHGGTVSYDIHIARETAELFKSNIFKLQIDELLQQVKIDQTHILKVEKFLHKLYDLIQRVPEWEGKTLPEVISYFKNKSVSVPFADPKPNPTTTNYKFGYKTPEISLIGSFALKTAIFEPQGMSVEVLATIPSTLLEKKDFLNFRCIHKRSVFLAYLTHHLSELLKEEKLDEILSLEYSYMDNDPLLPILKIASKRTEDSGDHEFDFSKINFSVSVIIGFPFKFFDSKKLLPMRNCIRIAREDTTSELPPTPFYNFSVLSASAYEPYLRYHYKTKKQTEFFKEASILGRLWLQQRGFSSNSSQGGGLSGFGVFEFNTLMAALLNGGGSEGNKILFHGFSSYQLFKGVIKYLATMDLCTSGHLEFHSDITYTHGLTRYIPEGFQTPTIFDKSTKINILTKLSPDSYNILKLYAQRTLAMLNDVVQDQFANVFLTNVTKLDVLKYDLCYDIKLPSNSNSILDIVSEKYTDVKKVTYITLERYLIHEITGIVKYALSDRIKAIEVEIKGQKTSFPVNKRKPIGVSSFGQQFNGKYIKVKILADPTASEKVLTKGPLHSEEPTPETSFFKNFWGSKASLRRFKDGSIAHCCVWESSSSRPIISTIISYALKRHLSENIEIDDLTSGVFQGLLPPPNLPAGSKTSVLSLSSFYNLRKSFDELYKVLFQLELPLSIKSILPVGPAFRYTSAIQPVPFAYSNPDFLQDVILEFETSSRWPDEIISLEKAKTAFLLKISDLLGASYGDKYRRYFTRDESIPYNLDVTTLNILTPEGYGFKFRILTERDEVLYLRAISNARNDQKQLLENVFIQFTSTYLASIRHTRTLENISHSYGFYSPVVRLFKKWLDTHLLLHHLKDELVELIAIKPFVDSAPYFIPGSVANGFLKILKFLSQWNWKEDPLILDLVKPDEDLEGDFETDAPSTLPASKTLKKLSEKLTLAQFKSIQGNFTNMRKSDPNGMHVQFFVASKNDPSGILYSSDVPLAIATRLTALAKVAINLIQTHGLSDQTVNLLFSPGLKDYDFVVHLRIPTSLKLSSGILSSSEFKNITNANAPTNFPDDLEQMSEKMDPTYQIVKYLNMKYKNSMIFSSHKYIANTGDQSGDQNVITGLIKPLFKKPLKFKVNMDCDAEPIDGENVVLNKAAIYHEVAAFGGSLITDFEMDFS